MEIIGKSTINPVIFYSGKILGYITWLLQVLSILNVVILERISYGYNDVISYVLFVTGLIIVSISMANLGRSTRFGLPVEKTIFKTKGLYRISRNPMYIGINLLTISAMIYTLNCWFILAGIYSIIVYHLIILSEERFLENRFEDDYKNYKKTVRRYI